MDPTQVVARLRELISEQEGKLIGLSADKAQARQIVETIHALQASIERASSHERFLSLCSKEYAGCRHAIDAIVLYLRERGTPATEDEIIDAVIAGGFGKGDENERNPIHSSLRIHLKGTGKRTRKLRYSPDGEKVGLGEWSDERFT